MVLAEGKKLIGLRADSEFMDACDDDANTPTTTAADSSAEPGSAYSIDSAESRDSDSMAMESASRRVRRVVLLNLAIPPKERGSFYAVRVGRQPGIDSAWDEVHKQVNNFVGAMYKKFQHRAAAEAYVSETSGS